MCFERTICSYVVELFFSFDCVRGGGLSWEIWDADLVGKFDEKIRENPDCRASEPMTILTVSQVRFVDIRK